MKYNSANKKKKRITSIISLLLIAVLLITSNITTTTAKADDLSGLVDSLSRDIIGGKQYHQHGVTKNNTGYLCYMVKAESRQYVMTSVL